MRRKRRERLASEEKSGQTKFDAAKKRLLQRLTAGVLRGEQLQSFVQMAKIAGVSRPTLRHYFGDENGVFAALLESWKPEAATTSLDPAENDAVPFLLSIVGQVRLAWEQGFRLLFEAGLDQRRPETSPLVVQHLLEPVLDAVQAAIEDCVAAELLPPLPLREAAISLISPVILSGLHQETLEGHRSHPLDQDNAFALHVQWVVDGWREAKT